MTMGMIFLSNDSKLGIYLEWSVKIYEALADFFLKDG